MMELAIPAPAGPLPAVCEVPVQTPAPGVLVVHDALGMSPDLRRHARWLADSGYVALAPDLYRGRGQLRCMFSFLRDETKPLGDLRAARDWLADDDRCTGTVGIMGFCMGGGFALMLAPDPRFSVASVSYGGLTRGATEALSSACPIVGHYGGRDRGLKNEPSLIRRALEAAGVDHDVRVYPDAGHSFMNDHSGSDVPWLFEVLGRLTVSEYDAAAEADARERILRFFGRHLAS